MTRFFHNPPQFFVKLSPSTMPLAVFNLCSPSAFSSTTFWIVQHTSKYPVSTLPKNGFPHVLQSMVETVNRVGLGQM
jgi:hypothetical protein